MTYSSSSKFRKLVVLFLLVAIPLLASDYTIVLTTGKTVQCDSMPVLKNGQYIFIENGIKKSLPARYVSEIRETASAGTPQPARGTRQSNQRAASVASRSTQHTEAVRKTRRVKVKIPVGTKIYGELDERVVSKKKHFKLGQRVKAKVWRDVRIDGRTVIKRGSRMGARVSLLKTNKMAGVKGKIEISADYVMTTDGQELPIQGGYGKEGKSYVGRTIALSVVLLPLIFIKGRKAELPPGTVFEAYTDQSIVVEFNEEYDPNEVEAQETAERGPFEITILYEELEKQKKPKYLDVVISVPDGQDLSPFVVSRVNGRTLKEPIEVEILKTDYKDGYYHSLTQIKLKKLIREFKKGLNSFTIESERPGYRDTGRQVMFEVEI